MKEGIKPTRMELLNTKQKLALAQKGHTILKQKRDALVLEFFSIIRQAQDLRTQLDKQVLKAYKSLAVAEAFHGTVFLQTAALASQQAPEIEVSTKNIMGVRIPAIEGVFVHRTLQERGYPIVGSSAKFDEAVSDFELALEYVIKLAETEAALKRLLKEIEKTNRRVNALEYNIQPDLKQTIKDVGQHLSQLENELFVGLKVTKRRLARKREAEENA
ncbi:MAG: V-type ATP synthase subunit D [Candidatus Micrarchaeota archaeon]